MSNRTLGVLKRLGITLAVAAYAYFGIWANMQLPGMESNSVGLFIATTFICFLLLFVESIVLFFLFTALKTLVLWIAKPTSKELALDKATAERKKLEAKTAAHERQLQQTIANLSGEVAELREKIQEPAGPVTNQQFDSYQQPRFS